MNSHNKRHYRLGELIHGLDVKLQGDPDCLIKGICTINQSQPQHISFLTNSRYRKFLENTTASAVILKEADAANCRVNAIITDNPYYIYAQIANYFEERRNIISGIHPTACIGEFCEIDPSATIGPHCVIGDHVRIGPHVFIGAGSVIGHHCEIGEETHLAPKVTLYSRVRIGKAVRVASGVVIGSDGFGFAQYKNEWHRVPQLGGVTIGDRVDIGANTAIDRGAIGDTVIEEGVKLDNLIQVGHNVRIGAHTVIAGCVGIAGSAVIGKNCMIGGASMIAGHLEICDRVMITGGTGVSKSITEPGIYSSGIVGAVTNQEFRRNNAHFHRLENLVQRVKELEQVIKDKKERK